MRFFRWLRKIFGRETVEDYYEARGIDVNERPPIERYRPSHKDRYSTIPARPITTHTPMVGQTVVVEKQDDFLTGFLVAEVISGGNPEAGLVGGAIGGVSGGLIAGELMPEPVQIPDSFSTPDPTPCSDFSSDSSSYDSGSSGCDSSSFDSGSSDSGGGW